MGAITNLKGQRLGQSPVSLPASGSAQGSSVPAAAKLNEATSPGRPGIALQLNGPQSVWSEINPPPSKRKENKKPQEASSAGRHKKEPKFWGSIQLQAGQLSARSSLPSSSGKVWMGVSHPIASCSSELMTFPGSQTSPALALGTPGTGAWVWHCG